MCWGDQRSDLHRLGSVGVAVTMVPSIIGCASDFWLSTEASDQHLGLWKLSDHSLEAGLMAASIAIFSEWSRTLPVVVGLSFGWSFYLYFSATCSLLLFGGLVAIARDRAMFDDLKQTKEITLL
ncbi:hypothetical protein C0Q70_01758 [Pomacea canaliculata]|uniref:Uncharacterized protein n=1 Tax=Pomacea canaliculata TaxID=400727 RepID=A0A2T7Q0F3_POMCA|nr:hypothetical protein C0Q70_01758 [Pomacea canaliculata]